MSVAGSIGTSALLTAVWSSWLLGGADGQSCGPRVSARLLNGIPCDMARSSFCADPGNAYPWTSLRRYIYENQGLMKRMYGEERYGSVLQFELRRRSYSAWPAKARKGRLLVPPAASGPAPHVFGVPRNDSHTEEGPPYEEHSSTTTSRNRPSTQPTTTDNQSEWPTSKDGSTEWPLWTEDDPTTTVADQTAPESTETTGEDSQMLFYQQTDSMHDDDHLLSSNSLEEPPQKRPPRPSPAPVVPILPASESSGADDKQAPVKGINACPVKEEVIAPYWANNTRGDTLALLNVYPFEQYVHWEKCAYEHHQMLCREGCRCEQQYRLHRLLAFDPRNECRGIFADWFRFPSCCVCVCYSARPVGSARQPKTAL